MTDRDKMIEALAKRMAWAGIAKYDASEDADDLWCNTLDYGQDHWLKVAAAVLDLCGPKRLVWLPASPPIKACRYDHVKSTCGRVMIEWKGWNDYEDSKVVSVDCWYACTEDTLEAAQAAAQAHLDAEHWANTPLGDIIKGMTEL